MEYPYTVELRNRKINFRPWKVQDKEALEQAGTLYEKRKALVYNCLENPKTPLDQDEYQYVLVQIRNSTLKHYETQYNFICSKCKKEYAFVANLNDIITPDFKPYTKIKTKNYTIELQDVCNQEFYENLMQRVEDSSSADKPNLKFLLDFILHIKTFNNSIQFTAESILDTVNQMDVEEFETIIRKWNSMRFKLNNKHIVTCPYCENEELAEFDTIPNFFPKSWSNLLSDLTL